MESSIIKRDNPNPSSKSDEFPPHITLLSPPFTSFRPFFIAQQFFQKFILGMLFPKFHFYWLVFILCGKYVVSPLFELKLRLHTTHPPDFWYSNRYSQRLFPYQKSGWWVVCRRSFNSTGGHTQKSFLKNVMFFNCKFPEITPKIFRLNKKKVIKYGNKIPIKKYHPKPQTFPLH